MNSTSQIHISGVAGMKLLDYCKVPSVNIGKLLIALDTEVTEILENFDQGSSKSLSWLGSISNAKYGSANWIEWAEFDLDDDWVDENDVEVSVESNLDHLELPRSEEPFSQNTSHQCGESLYLFDFRTWTVYVHNYIRGDFSSDEMQEFVEENSILIDDFGSCTLPIENSKVVELFSSFDHISSDSREVWIGCENCDLSQMTSKSIDTYEFEEDDEKLQLIIGSLEEIRNLEDQAAKSFVIEKIRLFLDEINLDEYEIEITDIRKSLEKKCH